MPAQDAETPELETVPLRSSAPADDEPPGAFRSEEAVPLRPAAQRTEADEEERRLRLVIGRRRVRRP